ncbi:hypothetical protein E2542_SST22938 [Spatholobus suberectus]|nr:hypothetical protein E2542_SST22938 [Spatholobus suberectus]
MRCRSANHHKTTSSHHANLAFPLLCRDTTAIPPFRREFPSRRYRLRLPETRRFVVRSFRFFLDNLPPS